MVSEAKLADLPDLGKAILKGQVKGRVVLAVVKAGLVLLSVAMLIGVLWWEQKKKGPVLGKAT